MTDQRQEGNAERARGRRIQVLIRDEDLDDVKAQGRTGVSRLLPEDVDVVEGQIYILHVPKPGDQTDDTEGQGRGGIAGLTQADEDTEGQGRISIRGIGQTDEDVDGQGRVSANRLDETDEDVDGQGRAGFRGVGQTDEDVEGQGGRYLGRLEPASPEDVEGHGGRYKSLRETDEGWVLEDDDDTEGHGRGSFNG